MNSPFEIHQKTQPVSPYLVMVIGVIAVSTAAILIRFAQNSTPATPSLVIAAVRLSLAALILTPVALRSHRPALRALSRKDFILTLLAGGVLSIHFASWITSLEHTSVLISVVLVTTNPLWVALLSPLILHEAIDRRTVAGILVAFAGGILISLPRENQGLQIGSDPLLGALLATIGAVAASFYLLIGRRLRASLDLIPYIWLCYSTAAIILLILVFLSGQTLIGYGTDAYIAMFLLAIVPQLIGHSSFNYALGHISAAYVSLIILAEPVGSTILAMLLFREIPTWIQVIGAGLILFAVAFAREAHAESLPNITEGLPKS